MQGASAREVVFDPRPILGVLVRHDVRFVVIGGIAASLQGSTTITNDFDICYARAPENLERLVRALSELHATLRGPRDPVVSSGRPDSKGRSELHLRYGLRTLRLPRLGSWGLRL